MPPEAAGNPLGSLFPIVAIFLIFYFIVIRPEKSKQKELKERIANIQKNDQVITAGGMHGRVVNVKPKTVIVRIDDNVKVELEKDSISTIQNVKDK